MTSYWSLMRTARCSDTIWLPYGRNRRFASAGIAAALLCLSLGGCIPFATPHLLDSDSRGDVTTATQQRLEVGKTTRVDVLLALGAPDGRAADDDWFTYGSARTSEVGGFLFLLVDGIGVEHVNTHVSRLLVKFDSNGIVSSVELQQSECSGFMAAQGCLDLKGKEL
jgi:outer membrane protein assembly factor BamE (lipoprotein component of BamABCDE complex)